MREDGRKDIVDFNDLPMEVQKTAFFMGYLPFYDIKRDVLNDEEDKFFFFVKSENRGYFLNSIQMIDFIVRHKISGSEEKKLFKMCRKNKYIIYKNEMGGYSFPEENEIATKYFANRES